MDITIRRNENCVIGLPRCDYVFSSTRTCFIAYGFKTSPMEMVIIRNLLEQRGIQCEEAGGQLAPGQNAFCQKICSKIITSQFCIVLLNQDEVKGKLIPNANVNIEYGLMLGFNKYLIPFQREKHDLPFNVAGLDTVKYTDDNFEKLAVEAIDIAITKTNQDSSSTPPPDQITSIFLLSKKLVYSDIEDRGEKNIFLLGSPFGFNLLHDFSGLVYHFLGNFTSFRPDVIIWRLKMLNDLLNARRGSIKERVEFGIVEPEKTVMLETFFSKLRVIVLVTTDEDKTTINKNMVESQFAYELEIYSLLDIKNELQKLTRGFS